MRLSELAVGRFYDLQADAVEATIQVVTPGVTPLCIVHGAVKDIINPDEAGFMLVQLIGWSSWGEDTMTPSGLQLFVLDKQPGSAWLIGVVMRPSGETEFVKLACAPTIKERATG